MSGWKSDSSMNSSDMQLLSIFESLVPLINGQDSKGKVAYLGPKQTIVHRYLLVLFMAQTITVFRLTGKDVDDNTYFTNGRLEDIAKTAFRNRPIKYDRIKTAMMMYRSFQEKGLVDVRNILDGTYITLTKDGEEICKKMLPGLIALAMIHDIIPKKFEVYQFDEELFGTRKGVRHRFRNPDLESVLDELVEKVTEINQALYDTNILDEDNQ